MLAGKMPSFYKRYVHDTLTIMPDTTTAANFLQVLNNCQTSVKFTMEKEVNGLLPFFGMQLLLTQVFCSTTKVDMRYKRGLLKTMLDRAYRLSSCWSYFSDECDRLKAVFTRLKYPQDLINTTVRYFVASKAEGPQPIAAPRDSSTVRIVLPFKDQASADLVHEQLKDLG